jgi:hypothetical protein
MKRALKKTLRSFKDDRGSISVLTIALFLITICLVMITTNITTVTIAKRNLTQSAESVAQNKGK